jgi:hypothetical protein
MFDRERRRAEFIIIHELLHSLGLGENPPTDRVIDAQIARRSAGDTPTVSVFRISHRAGRTWITADRSEPMSDT